MNYETVMNNIKKSHIVTITHVNEVVDELLNTYEDDEEQSWEHLNELMKVLTAADIQTYNGDSDHYHNLAVSLARAGQFSFACGVLELGLKFYGESQDLLADFLAYAAKCNVQSEDNETARKAEECYQKLMSMDKSSLGWRAFDFSIDYLSAKLLRAKNEAEKQRINSRIDELLDGYQKIHSQDEKPYFAQYIVSTLRNEKDAEKKLQEKMENFGPPAPRCNMKLAEYFFKNGRYKEAETYIDKCKRITPSVEQAVEPGSIYTLSALCGMCRIYADGIENLKPDDKPKLDDKSKSDDKPEQKNELEIRVRRVYKDCAAAHAIYLKRRFSKYKELEIQRNVLEQLSEIPYVEE